MEHTFGAGTLINDASPPWRYGRRPPATRRPRTLATALGVAFAGLLLLGGVAYGGATSGAQNVTVHRGDTIWAIAASHYPGQNVQQRVADIEASNHLSGAGLSPGQILTLPAS